MRCGAMRCIEPAVQPLHSHTAQHSSPHTAHLPPRCRCAAVLLCCCIKPARLDTRCIQRLSAHSRSNGMHQPPSCLFRSSLSAQHLCASLAMIDGHFVLHGFMAIEQCTRRHGTTRGAAATTTQQGQLRLDHAFGTPDIARRQPKLSRAALVLLKAKSNRHQSKQARHGTHGKLELEEDMLRPEGILAHRELVAGMACRLA